MVPYNSEKWALIAASTYPFASLVFGILGVIYVVRFGLRIGTVLVQTFLLPGKSLKTFGAKEGAWAVVTGATDGIGREFALQLARAGFNVFLASRSSEKLALLASEIETQYGIQTKTQAIDFSKPDHPAWSALKDTLTRLDVGILVNNVGKSHEMPVDFVDSPQDERDDILQVNINSTLKITSIVLPGLISRKRGLIITLGSFVGCVFSSPMLATYSGSKAFLSTWSQSLAKEVESKGVNVYIVNTAFVVSKMSKIRRPNLITPTAKHFVQAVLSKIGVPGGAYGQPYATTPYWSHSIVNAFVNELSWPSFWINYMSDINKATRRRALAKKGRDAAAKQE